jgi:hypothetical protein
MPRRVAGLWNLVDVLRVPGLWNLVSVFRVPRLPSRLGAPPQVGVVAACSDRVAQAGWRRPATGRGTATASSAPALP